MFSENYSRQTAIASATKVLAADLTDHELATLARSEEAKVRAAVAERPTTPLTSLLLLAQDVAPAVRAGVARNQRADLPIEMRQDLAKDKSSEVVYALIENPATPDSILSKLSHSFHRDYAGAAKQAIYERKNAWRRQVAYGEAVNQPN
ncbi:MAG: hypothetical protein ABUL56_00310 [Actinomycetota bacterium]